MSSDPTAQAGGSSTAPGGASGQPSEAELRAAYEAELSRITPAEMMLQAAVSLLNIGARRLGLTGGPEHPQPDAGAQPDAQAGARRDLGQVRDAIDGVSVLLEILERSAPEQLRPLRDALSQLQLAYAREAQVSGGSEGAKEPARPEQGQDAPQGEERSRAPGPAQASGRLWVPGS